MDIMQDIIYPAIDDINTTLPADRHIKKTPDYRLIGKESLLDSIQIVSFVVAIEEVILEVLGKDITLLDEEAMTKGQNPLTNLSSLADYVADRLNILEMEAS